MPKRRIGTVTDPTRSDPQNSLVPDPSSFFRPDLDRPPPRRLGVRPVLNQRAGKATAAFHDYVRQKELIKLVEQARPGSRHGSPDRQCCPAIPDPLERQCDSPLVLTNDQNFFQPLRHEM